MAGCDDKSGNNNPWVSVIIVNYNSGDYLRQCIDGLLAQTFLNFEVVLVDNGSNDGSLEKTKTDDPRFRIIRAGENLGFAKANNIAAQESRAPWIATLNPDAVPERDWLNALHDATVMYPQTAMFGSTQLMLEDPTRLDGFGDAYSFLGIPWRGGHGHPIDDGHMTGEAFSPCAAAALYSREAFMAVGGFDESFFCYLEDIDLGFRLRLMGERCIQVRAAVVSHEGSATSGRRSHFTLFHSARNRVWVILKNMPISLLIVLLPLHVLATIWLLFRVQESGWRASTIAGLRASVTSVGAILRSRSKIQRERRVGAIRIAKALNWNIATLRERRADIRAINVRAL
jgi:N-acetylglucosaminyl-diphospho-decaprenol L-rhamnosyltransferase